MNSLSVPNMRRAVGALHVQSPRPVSYPLPRAAYLPRAKVSLTNRALVACRRLTQRVGKCRAAGDAHGGLPVQIPSSSLDTGHQRSKSDPFLVDFELVSS